MTTDDVIEAVRHDLDRLAELRAGQRDWIESHDWRLLEDSPGRRVAVWAMANPDENDELAELLELLR